jgi:DNA-binding MarR family transcriptional regulator
VSRVPDPADRRAKLIVATPSGRDEIAKARAILGDIERRHRRQLGDEVYRGFRSALEQVTQAQSAWERP